MSAPVGVPDLRGASPRYPSVDALRGVAVAAMLLVNYPGDWTHVYPPLMHAAWHGFTPTDLIFPLFLFIVGVSIALSLLPAREGLVDTTRLSRQVVRRALRIVALGLALHGLAWILLAQETIRLPGVLQRIGLCYGVVGLLAIHTRERTQAGLFVALLLGYWALLVAGGSFDPWINFASRIDAAVFARHAYLFDPATGLGHDPEGLASTLPAIATTLFGLMAGRWLRQGKLRRLTGAAIVALALGALWSGCLPWNKNLWTPSYVLWTGGLSMGLLAAAHLLVDRRGAPAWGRSFGLNAIAAYAGSSALYLVGVACGVWETVYRVGFAGWMTPLSGAAFASLAFALVYVALWWAIVRGMQTRGWYPKI